jgi:hypothetical protein
VRRLLDVYFQIQETNCDIARSEGLTIQSEQDPKVSNRIVKMRLARPLTP